MKKELIKIQIKNIYDNVIYEYECEDNTVRTTLENAVENGANLDGANLYRANLYRANLDGANLDGANLDGANLDGANLYRANLDGANLDGANLYRANLDRANLNGAKNLEPLWVCDLYSIKMQDPETKLRYWKFVDGDKSPIHDKKLTYKVGKTVTEKDCDNNESEACGAGLNVATLQWCLKNTISNNSADFIEVEFKVSDIVAVPYYSDGKFRVKELKVLRKLSREEVLTELKQIAKWSWYD